MSNKNSPLLKNALLANGIFCMLSGLDFILFSGTISRFLGISSSWIIFGLGVGLTIYGYQVYTSSRSTQISDGFAKFAIYADLVWVAGSVILIFTSLVNLTTPGKWVIAIVADIVLAFAILQFLGLRRRNSG